jgi:hypothetical protein
VCAGARGALAAPKNRHAPKRDEAGPGGLLCEQNRNGRREGTDEKLIIWPDFFFSRSGTSQKAGNGPVPSFFVLLLHEMRRSKKYW